MPSAYATAAGSAGATFSRAALKAERYERRLAERLPAHAFYTPTAPLTGAALERRVSRALTALYDAERDDQAPAVERALRGLYGAER